MWVLDAYTKWQSINVDDSGGLQMAQMDTEDVSAKEDNIENLNELMES